MNATIPSPTAPRDAERPGRPKPTAGGPKLTLPDRRSLRRLGALGRAEMTLLIRNRTALTSALLMPLLMIGFFATMAETLGMEDSDLTISALVATSGVGMVLLMVVYTNLITSYVARREERVLKRLRTGEASDAEIFTGAALPSLALALIQVLVLVLAGSAHPSLSLPSRPDLLLLGVVLGCAMMTMAAIATAALTRTVESAQITAMPVFIVGMLTSGMVTPIDTLPDTVADIFRLMPLTPVMDLVRAGWVGSAGGADLLQAVVVGVAWTAIAAYVGRRWFRWDPRS